MVPKDLRKLLQDKAVILSLFTLLMLIMPGLMVIQIYLPSLITNLDWIKLTLISISFTAPFVILNSIFIAAVGPEDRSTDALFFDLVLGTLTTALGVYLGLIASHIFNLFSYHPFKFPYSNETLLVASVEIIIIFRIWLSRNET